MRPFHFQGPAWLILDCARRTSTFLSCAFREQEDDQAAFQSSSPPFKGVARLPFTARIERAQLHRARSASKKGTWPLPISIFRRACIVVVFFAVDGTEALFLEQRCGVCNHGAVPAEIHGEILDRCDSLLNQLQNAAG